METSEYRTMYELEFSHWWYQGLDDLLLHTIPRLPLPTQPKLLDAGCGTGRILHKLGERVQGFGLDFSTEAVQFCFQRDLKRVCRGSLLALPYQSAQFDLIVSLDVLYHQGIPDDQIALKEFWRVLKSGGYLILNLAALEILRGQHDEQVQTRERYHKAMLLERIQRAGFMPVFISYRLFLLFPLMLLRRWLSRQSRGPSSDLEAVPGWLNRVLYSILWLENRWMRWASLPVGSSLFLVARKP